MIPLNGFLDFDKITLFYLNLVLNDLDEGLSVEHSKQQYLQYSYEFKK